MRSQFYQFKNKAVSLRKNGKTYGEIRKTIGKPIPKSTLSEWFKNIKLSKKQQQRIKDRISDNIHRGHVIALEVNKEKRKKYLDSVTRRVIHLKKLTVNQDIAKIIVAMLYLGEGSKTKRGSLMFGNSDPRVIALFLRLLRQCYNINEDKFRCTLQCRADQNIETLERFWSKITNVPLKQFYKARVDSRTIGKKSRKMDYKGVCRIDYFSADLFNEIMKIIEVISMGH